MLSALTGALPGRKVWLCFVLALALLLSHGAISQAQPPTTNFGYVFLTGSGSVREDNPHFGARLQVNRLLVGMPHDSQSFRIYFTGSATAGVDFQVKGVTLSGSCFTGSWKSGNWFTGAEKTYYIVGISDNTYDPKETITATVSSVNWPSSYSLFGSYDSASFKIYGD